MAWRKPWRVLECSSIHSPWRFCMPQINRLLTVVSDESPCKCWHSTTLWPWVLPYRQGAGAGLHTGDGVGGGKEEGPWKPIPVFYLVVGLGLGLLGKSQEERIGWEERERRGGPAFRGQGWLLVPVGPEFLALSWSDALQEEESKLVCVGQGILKIYFSCYNNPTRQICIAVAQTGKLRLEGKRTGTVLALVSCSALNPSRSISLPISLHGWNLLFKPSLHNMKLSTDSSQGHSALCSCSE